MCESKRKYICNYLFVAKWRIDFFRMNPRETGRALLINVVSDLRLIVGPNYPISYLTLSQYFVWIEWLMYYNHGV